MIEARGLRYAYAGSPEMVFPDVHCYTAEKLLILGDSGCGKTTLLQLLAGLRKPKSGEVIIREENIYQKSGSSLDQFRGKHIGIVFQTPHFLKALSMRENVALAQRLAGHKIDYTKVDHLLDVLEISHRRHAHPYACSQGEQQRASIARALINQPTLVLADEPTSALDDRHCMEVLHLLEKHVQAIKASLIIVTHDQRLKNYIPKAINLTAHA